MCVCVCVCVCVCGWFKQPCPGPSDERGRFGGGVGLGVGGLCLLARINLITNGGVCKLGDVRKAQRLCQQPQS